MSAWELVVLLQRLAWQVTRTCARLPISALDARLGPSKGRPPARRTAQPPKGARGVRSGLR
eukprot:3276455-Alexandrium_andersonii.AAC.1